MSWGMNHARMLDHAVGVDQFRADDTYAPELAPAYQLFQPIRMNHLDIIIEKQEIISVRGGCSEIARRGVVERLVERNNRHYA